MFKKTSSGIIKDMHFWGPSLWPGEHKQPPAPPLPHVVSCLVICWCMILLHNTYIKRTLSSSLVISIGGIYDLHCAGFLQTCRWRNFMCCFLMLRVWSCVLHMLCPSWCSPQKNVSFWKLGRVREQIKVFKKPLFLFLFFFSVKRTPKNIFFSCMMILRKSLNVLLSFCCLMTLSQSSTVRLLIKL